MGESNNGIIWRALRRIYTLLGAVLGVVILLVDKFTQYIPEKYFLQAVLGAVILFLVGIIISAHFEGKKTIRLEEHQKKVLDLEATIKNIERQIVEHYPKNKLVDKKILSYVDVEYARDELIEDIRGFSPDVIIGVDRGGAIVGGLLAKYLKRPLTTMSSSDKWTISKSILSSLDDGIKDSEERAKKISKILLVDDACRTGATLKKAYNTLKEIQGYLFSWDEIPRNDNKKFKEFLKQKFSIDWVEEAIIEKIDDGKTIRVSTENNSLSLRLNDLKTKVNLKIDDGRTDEFIVMIENSKLTIYRPGYEFELKTATILNEDRELGPSKVCRPNFYVYETEQSNVRMPWDKGKSK